MASQLHQYENDMFNDPTNRSTPANANRGYPNMAAMRTTSRNFDAYAQPGPGAGAGYLPEDYAPMRYEAQRTERLPAQSMYQTTPAFNNIYENPQNWNGNGAGFNSATMGPSSSRNRSQARRGVLPTVSRPPQTTPVCYVC